MGAGRQMEAGRRCGFATGSGAGAKLRTAFQLIYISERKSQAAVPEALEDFYFLGGWGFVVGRATGVKTTCFASAL